MIAAYWFSSWVPVAVWAGLIFYLSGIPSLDSGLGIWDTLLRKAAHVIEFGVLTYLLLRASVRSWPASTKEKLMAWAGVVALIYAASDEIHQSFVPGRGPSVYDVLIDGVGIALVLFIYRRKILKPC